MKEVNRRSLLQFSALGSAVVASRIPASFGASSPASSDIRLGLYVEAGSDPAGAIRKVRELGFPTCQVGVEEYGSERKTQLLGALKGAGVEITALGVVGPGKKVWDFYEGPKTIGVVPKATRRVRIDHVKKASDFAKECGIGAIHSHAGFIPEDPNDPLYAETVQALKEVAGHIRANGQILLYETGQESPVTLLRAIQDVGLDNQFVNLDTANLILYGKGNPVDALDVLGKLVRGVHAKDGLFPTDPKKLGQEVPIGQGRVDFPLVIKKLRQLGYKGAITIERETSGPQQVEDVKKAKAYLEKLLSA
jgi:L-ribulose-5-phosphate 3-epimerase